MGLLAERRSPTVTPPSSSRTPYGTNLVMFPTRVESFLGYSPPRLSRRSGVRRLLLGRVGTADARQASQHHLDAAGGADRRFGGPRAAGVLRCSNLRVVPLVGGGQALPPSPLP